MFDAALDAMTARYTSFPTMYAIYAIGEDPLGSQATQLGLEDEGGGPFFTLMQGENMMRIDIAEWRLLVECASKMLVEYPYKEKARG
jgi:hypothetical protein